MGRTWRPRSLHPDACEKTALTSRRADSAAQGRPRPSAARPHAGWLHAARGGDRDLGRAQGPAGAGNAEASGERGTCRGKDRFLVQPLTPHVRDRRFGQPVAALQRPRWQSSVDGQPPGQLMGGNDVPHSARFLRRPEDPLSLRHLTLAPSQPSPRTCTFSFSCPSTQALGRPETSFLSRARAHAHLRQRPGPGPWAGEAPPPSSSVLLC